MDITVAGVSFAYEGSDFVLEEVDLTARHGELFALIGPNGSGKSTLLKVISGVLRPLEGAVRLGGTPLRALSTRQIAQRLAMVEQDRQIGFDFTVREIVAMGRIAHRGRFVRETDSDRRAIERAMALTDIERFADRTVHAVSGGERQRVFLATALAQEPKALLLDEPTTHLDLRHQVQFMSIVRTTAEEGTTILIAIHDLTLAAQATTRIALMRKGRIVVTGTPGEVLTQSYLQHVFGVDVVVGSHPEPRILYVLPTVPRRNAEGS
jgi:iron complex transport system ATP-binding protein